MTQIVFTFEVHQPHRLRPYRVFDIGRDGAYFDDRGNREILRRVAYKSYLPMNKLLFDAIERTNGGFRFGMSLSGTVLEQLEAWAPEVLETFQALVATGAVELLTETSHHSLVFLDDAEAFAEQVQLHRERVQRLFGVRPRVFRHTELALSNELAQRVEAMGFDGVLGEGVDRVLGDRDAHQVVRPAGCDHLKALLRSYRLSDDIAFRFSDRRWAHHPLSADRYAAWLHELPADADVVGLFMDYETFGEHQGFETGIFAFMQALPDAVLADDRFAFTTPSEAIDAATEPAPLDIPWVTSWADAERDLSAWLGNAMQRSAAQAIHALAPLARAAEDNGRADLTEAWRRLTTSDHLYYMSTKADEDGAVHGYFSPYATPYDAFITFMNVVEDLGRRLAAVPRVEAVSRSVVRPDEDAGLAGV